MKLTDVADTQQIFRNISKIIVEACSPPDAQNTKYAIIPIQ
jgi:hypothetical protein